MIIFIASQFTLQPLIWVADHYSLYYNLLVINLQLLINSYPAIVPSKKYCKKKNIEWALEMLPLKLNLRDLTVLDFVVVFLGQETLVMSSWFTEPLEICQTFRGVSRVAGKPKELFHFIDK